MEQVLGLRCTICGAEYAPDEVEYVCPRHGDDGTLDVVYDYEQIRQRFLPEKLAGHPARSIWRYLPLLPVDAGTAARLTAGTVLGSVGWTPLYPAPRLAGGLGLGRLWVKDDGRQPTASFKDRASAIAVCKAQELGYGVVTTASTGNAAAALAGMCAGVGQANVIFLPRTAPQAKIAQLLVYGSQVLLVDGTYDDAFELCLRAAPEFGWYSRNTGYNPYMSEGKKTASYEICEQLTAAASSRGEPESQAPWTAPDVVVVPVGDGCIIGGVHKGFQDLLALGWIERMPRLVGVQAAGSSPLVDAWERGLEGWEMQPVEAHSLADSIVAGLPRDRIKALRAVRHSGGAFLRVTDDQIVAAIPALARGCGVFAEPAAAASYAGLHEAVKLGLIHAGEEVVILATGSGLKDVATAIKSIGQPAVVAPDLDAVRRALNLQSGE
ncbi:MAG: pyridoxal-phosphate dependent enzyme [Anaerolineaceae bacterium]|nr:pyridoxal-phosphate dependent enzyme [Anaerolineaceae bacterium]